MHQIRCTPIIKFDSTIITTPKPPLLPHHCNLFLHHTSVNAFNNTNKVCWTVWKQFRLRKLSVKEDGRYEWQHGLQRCRLMLLSISLHGILGQMLQFERKFWLCRANVMDISTKPTPLGSLYPPSTNKLNSIFWLHYVSRKFSLYAFYFLTNSHC